MEGMRAQQVVLARAFTVACPRAELLFKWELSLEAFFGSFSSPSLSLFFFIVSSFSSETQDAPN